MINEFFDTVTIIVLVLVVAIGALLGHYVITQINPSDITCAGNATCQRVISQGGEAFKMFDIGILLVYVGATLAALISAAYVESSPFFFIGTILVNLMLWLLLPTIANLYIALQNQPIFASIIGVHPIALFFFQNLPLIGIMTALLIAWRTHGKQAARPTGF